MDGNTLMPWTDKQRHAEYMRDYRSRKKLEALETLIKLLEDKKE